MYQLYALRDLLGEELLAFCLGTDRANMQHALDNGAGGTVAERANELYCLSLPVIRAHGSNVLATWLQSEDKKLPAGTTPAQLFRQYEYAILRGAICDLLVEGVATSST